MSNDVGNHPTAVSYALIKKTLYQPFEMKSLLIQQHSSQFGMWLIYELSVSRSLKTLSNLLWYCKYITTIKY